MKLRQLIVASAVAAVVADASAFEWTPVITQPNPSLEVTSGYTLENMIVYCQNVPGVSITDVMPVWIDEDGAEIAAVSGAQNPNGWDPTEFHYNFRLSEFKSNGEYLLRFPEGMLVNADGEKSKEKVTPYTVEIPELASAMFDDFKILSISPDLSQPQGYWSDKVLTINTNHNEAIGYTLLRISEKATGEGVVYSQNYTTERHLGDPSPISWEVVGDYKFTDDKQYIAEIIFFNGSDEADSEGIATPVVAKETYEFTGKIEAFKYSAITLENVTPDPVSSVVNDPSQAVFTYTFSGPVNVYDVVSPRGQWGMEVYPASCLSSNDEKTVWTLDLSQNEYVKTIDTELTIQLYARDLDGFQLKGNQGVENESCFEYSWSCDIGAQSIVVVSPKRGESLDRLTEVIVRSESGEAMTYNWGEMSIQNLLGDNLGTLLYDGDGSPAAEFRFTQWIPADGDGWTAEPIDMVEEGSYVIYFSTGCFVFGEEFSSINSRSLYSGFQITGNLDEKPDVPVIDPAEQEVFNYTKVSPENGSTVLAIDKIQIWFPEEISLDGDEVYVYDSNQQLVTKGKADFNWATFEFDYLIIEFSRPVAADGKYEVVIPARCIRNDAFAESDGKAGICNPEIRLSYTVDTSGSGVASVEDASLCDVCDMQGRVVLRNASADDVNALSKGIYVVNGKKLVVK